jgi:hypothetical protein
MAEWRYEALKERRWAQRVAKASAVASFRTTGPRVRLSLRLVDGIIAGPMPPQKEPQRLHGKICSR